MSRFTTFFRSLLQRSLLQKPPDVKHLSVNEIQIDATAEKNQKKRKTDDEASNDEDKVRIHFVLFV
jgi:hypothetical protein